MIFTPDALWIVTTVKKGMSADSIFLSSANMLSFQSETSRRSQRRKDSDRNPRSGQRSRAERKTFREMSGFNQDFWSTSTAICQPTTHADRPHRRRWASYQRTRHPVPSSRSGKRPTVTSPKMSRRSTLHQHFLSLRWLSRMRPNLYVQHVIRANLIWLTHIAKYARLRAC